MPGGKLICDCPIYRTINGELQRADDGSYIGVAYEKAAEAIKEIGDLRKKDSGTGRGTQRIPSEGKKEPRTRRRNEGLRANRNRTTIIKREGKRTNQTEFSTKKEMP
jgi:hypothetical protein